MRLSQTNIGNIIAYYIYIHFFPLVLNNEQKKLYYLTLKNRHQFEQNKKEIQGKGYTISALHNPEGKERGGLKGSLKKKGYNSYVSLVLKLSTFCPQDLSLLLVYI